MTESLWYPLMLFLTWAIGSLALMRMRPRRFYFIRHGETELNAAHIRQGEEGALSENGRAQASRVGEALRPAHIRMIITSSYPRAIETGNIMNEHVHVPQLASTLFAERRNPREIIGKKRDLPDVKKIVDTIENAYHADYRFSDEENFLDLKRRARKSLSLLARQGKDHTVIVTHHVFLKMLLAYMLYHEELHAGDFVKLSYFNFSDNATVTVCDFHPWKFFTRSRGWQVISFNEQPENVHNL